MKVRFPTDLQLRPTRAHEVCGPSAAVFAACHASQQDGPILWITEVWRSDRLHPRGLSRFFDPARLVLIEARRAIDVLWSAEEGLRSGAVGMVVAELTRAPDLTASRRLQLAAEAGGTLGLFIIPEGTGSNAAETRWHATPIRGSGAVWDSTPMRWRTIKNKRGTLVNAEVAWDATAHRLLLDTTLGKRAAHPPQHAL
ncbi:MAG: hypothetical protein AAFQ36_09520 [Pseudomonadota bacterium]